MNAETTEYRVTIATGERSWSYLYIVACSAERAREIAEWHLFARCSQATISAVDEDF